MELMMMIIAAVGLWFGLGETSPLKDWADSNRGLYFSFLFIGLPTLFIMLR